METKVCRICKEEKPLSAFRKRVYKGGKEGKSTKCAICDNKYIRDCKLKRTHPNESDRKVQSLEGEIWVKVSGYEDRYEISNYGRLKSLPHRKMPIEVLMTASLNNHGYYYFTLSKNSQRNNLFQHRLMAKAFIQNPENKPHINHINNNPKDNRLENLEWCTQSENMSHASRQDRMQRGQDRPLSKLTEEDVMYIFMSKDNNTILSKKFNVSPSSCWCIKNGKSWSWLTNKKHERKSNSKRNKSAA